MKYLLISLLPLWLYAINLNDAFDSLKCDRVYKTSIYRTCYSFSMKGPIAVIYNINKDTLDLRNIQSHRGWREYKIIPYVYRQRNIDYLHKMDRGHLAPDAVFDYSKTVVNKTYYLGINSVPQYPVFNRHVWLHLERHVRDMVRTQGSATVLNYVEYGNKLMNNISVPKYMYKMVNINDTTTCFKYENTPYINTLGYLSKNHIVECGKVIKQYDLEQP